jgi:site-specific DNA-methyltransferase (adenine-specific)
MGNIENLKIIYKSVEDLIPYADNPRKNDKAVDLVAESIQQVGFKNPIITDGDGVIIAGHTRLKAARKLGLKMVPVIVADDLTPEQAKMYRLADNKTGEAADWDQEKLDKELEELYQAGIDMSVFGFEPLQVDVGDVVDDDYEPEIPEEPRCKRGQLWAMGRHRLMVGDSTSPEDLKILLENAGGTVDMVVTDPPYNVDYDSKEKALLLFVSNKRVEKNQLTGIQNDSMEAGEFIEFLTKAFTLIKQALKPGGAFYIWLAAMRTSEFLQAAAAADLFVHQHLVWVKNHFTLGFSDYKWQHEPCLYGWTEGAAHYFNHSVYPSTVNQEELPNMKKEELVEIIRNLLNDQTDVIRQDKPVKSDLHPTMKPVELFAGLIANSSQKGESVLDLFGGSGTTVIAAEQLGRTAYVMELEPKYATVILDRYEKFTGQKPELLQG